MPLTDSMWIVDPTLFRRVVSLVTYQPEYSKFHDRGWNATLKRQRANTVPSTIDLNLLHIPSSAEAMMTAQPPSVPRTAAASLYAMHPAAVAAG